MPSVPTLAEAGGPPGFEASGFVALLAPKGTPEAIRARINRDLLEAVSSADMRARYKTFNFDVSAASPADTRRLIEARSATYEQVIRHNDIKLD